MVAFFLALISGFLCSRTLIVLFAHFVRLILLLSVGISVFSYNFMCSDLSLSHGTHSPCAFRVRLTTIYLQSLHYFLDKEGHFGESNPHWSGEKREVDGKMGKRVEKPPFSRPFSRLWTPNPVFPFLLLLDVFSSPFRVKNPVAKHVPSPVTIKPYLNSI
jgi:hypothetical protein